MRRLAKHVAAAALIVCAFAYALFIAFNKRGSHG